MASTQDQPDVVRLLKPADVARSVGVNRETVLRWLRDGTLPGIKLPGNAGWRIHPDVLTAWLQARQEGAQP